MDDLRENWLAEVEHLLRQRIGLNPEAVGKNHIRDAVSQCSAVRTGGNLSDYLMRLRTHDDDFQELVERLVVPESWFFRDVEPFRCLEHWLRTRLPMPSPLRVLSVPCGSGEEPYSMAMTLLNAGLPAGQLIVDAVDISQRVLRQATEGCFGELSFRERIEPVVGFRDRWLRRESQQFVINEEVRSCVHFRQANVVASKFLEGEEQYHVIFCRNLLIYLDASARRVALGNVHRLLSADGLLYVGHVEGAAVLGELFGRYGSEFPFAFQPVLEGKEGRRIEVSVAESPVRETVDKKPRAVGAPLPAKVRTPRKVKPSTGDARAEFEKARQAADGGQLADAQSQCVELLTKYPPQAEVYCLLGVVRQALGEASEAMKCFHKALYLDPQHHETLVHAELLARKCGEEQLANQYRRRAERSPYQPEA